MSILKSFCFWSIIMRKLIVICVFALAVLISCKDNVDKNDESSKDEEVSIKCKVLDHAFIIKNNNSEDVVYETTDLGFIKEGMEVRCVVYFTDDKSYYGYKCDYPQIWGKNNYNDIDIDFYQDTFHFNGSEKSYKGFFFDIPIDFSLKNTQDSQSFFYNVFYSYDTKKDTIKKEIQFSVSFNKSESVDESSKKESVVEKDKNEGEELQSQEDDNTEEFKSEKEKFYTGKIEKSSNLARSASYAFFAELEGVPVYFTEQDIWNLYVYKPIGENTIKLGNIVLDCLDENICIPAANDLDCKNKELVAFYFPSVAGIFLESNESMHFKNVKCFIYFEFQYHWRGEKTEEDLFEYFYLKDPKIKYSDETFSATFVEHEMMFHQRGRDYAVPGYSKIMKFKGYEFVPTFQGKNYPLLSNSMDEVILNYVTVVNPLEDYIKNGFDVSEYETNDYEETLYIYFQTPDRILNQYYMWENYKNLYEQHKIHTLDECHAWINKLDLNDFIVIDE